MFIVYSLRMISCWCLADCVCFAIIMLCTVTLFVLGLFTVLLGWLLVCVIVFMLVVLLISLLGWFIIVAF